MRRDWGAELTPAGRVTLIVRQAHPKAGVLRISLVLVPLMGATGVAGMRAAADSPNAPPVPSTEAAAPLSTEPKDGRFASAAWAARKLTYQPLTVQAGGGDNIVTGSTEEYMRGAGNAEIGVTWFPSSAVPLGLRLDGSYAWFRPESRLLALGGLGYNRGERNVYGADLDLQLDLARASSKQKVYVMAGFGEYRLSTSLQKLSPAPVVCGNNFCGTFPRLLASESGTSAWEPSFNVGLGWAMALDVHVSMFVEARYRHIFTPGYSAQYIPVSVGLRF